MSYKFDIYLCNEKSILSSKIQIKGISTCLIGDVLEQIKIQVKLRGKHWLVFISRNKVFPNDLSLEKCFGSPSGETEDVYIYLSKKEIHYNKPIVEQLSEVFLDQLEKKYCDVPLTEMVLQMSSLGPSIKPDSAHTISNNRPPLATNESIKNTSYNTGPPKLQPIVPVDPTKWECPLCTMSNDLSNINCTICGELNPAEPLVGIGGADDGSWDCKVCSRRNDDNALNCDTCGSGRVTDNYDNDVASYLAEQNSITEEMMTYLKSSMDEGYIRNYNIINCPLCLDDVGENDGIILRSCTHEFCADCLRKHLKTLQDPIAKCPFNTEEKQNADSCSGVIEHREIKALLKNFEGAFEEYLRRETANTARTLSGSCLCVTPNCVGFVIVDEVITQFNCDVCGKLNCISCRAQHENITCKDYQDEQRRLALRDVNVRKSLEMLQEMVKKGEAMECPGCKILIQKLIGCDWIQCSSCKLEICWATKQARWGPKGRGDTSGGCKCNVNKVKCTPTCGNCH